MKIVFLTLGDESVASSRTRVFQYLPHLHELGIETEVVTYTSGLDYRLLAFASRGIMDVLVRIFLKGVNLFHGIYSFFQVGRVGRKARTADILFIQKVLLPLRVQGKLRALNPKIVFDYDDALYADEKSYDKALFDAQLAASKLLVLENESTEAYARKFNVPCLRITGPIDCQRYSPARRPETRPELVVGWVGSRSTTAYLEMLKAPLRQLSEKYPTLYVELIGAGAIDLPGVRVRRWPWNLNTEVNLLRRFDVGLMPLDDNEFTRGKGGYKILQYMAMGLPTVASPVGVNAEIVQPGQTGFLCREPEWLGALDTLLGNSGLRAKMGETARRRADELYSFEASTPKLVKALQGL